MEDAADAARIAARIAEQAPRGLPNWPALVVKLSNANRGEGIEVPGMGHRNREMPISAHTLQGVEQSRV